MHHQLDQNLAIGGTALANTTEQLILDKHNLGALFDRLEREEIIKAGATTLGDITTVNDDGRTEWTQTNRLPAPCLSKITRAYDNPQGPPLLRAGQCWLLTHDNCAPDLGQVTEILGFTSTKRDQVYIRVWENKLNRPLEYGDVLTISPDTYSTGGGTNIIRSVQELFTTVRAEAVTMTCDTKGVKTQPRLFRTYKSTRWQLAPTNFLPTPADETLMQLIKNAVRDNGINQCKIFTDGSYTDNNSALEKILESPDLRPPIATAGLVITDASDQWKQRPVISVHFAHDDNVNATSVFHMECMALTLALALSDKELNCQGIYTDSESAYKLIKRPRRIPPSSHAPLIRILQRHTPRVRNLVQHIHSHSEQLTRDKDRWTHDMYGNHLADRAAANDISSLQNFQHIHINTLKTGHILTQAQREPYWYVADASRLMTLDTITNAMSKFELRQYLQNRDAKRAKRGAPPKWTTGLSYNIAATQFEMNKKRANIGSAARAIRIIFDKYYQPWNVAKYANRDDAICPECGEKDSLQHLLATCTHPMYTHTSTYTCSTLHIHQNTCPRYT